MIGLELGPTRSRVRAAQAAALGLRIHPGRWPVAGGRLLPRIHPPGQMAGARWSGFLGRFRLRLWASGQMTGARTWVFVLGCQEEDQIKPGIETGQIWPDEGILGLLDLILGHIWPVSDARVS